MKVVLKSKGDGLNAVPDFNQEIEVEGTTTLLDITNHLDDGFEWNVCLLNEDKVLKSFKGDESLSDYLDNLGLVLEDGLIFLAMTYDTYLSYHPSSDEEYEEDEESEDGTDREDSPKSRNDKDSDSDGDDDKPDGGSASASTASPLEEMIKKMEGLKLTAEKSMEEYLNMKKVVSKMRSDAKKEKSKKLLLEKREAQKKEKAKERATTININFVLGDKRFVIAFTKDTTIKDVRDKVRDHIGTITKKHFKNNRFLKGDVDLSSHRKTVGGYEINDGTVINIQGGISGGGKRAKTGDESSSKSKTTTLQDLKETVGTKLIRLNANPNISVAVEDAKKKIITIMSLTKDNTKNAIAEMLKEFPVEILKRLATEVLPSSTRVPDRCKTIADILFEASVEALSEVEKQKRITTEALCLSVQYVIISQYADLNGSISWQSFLTTVSDVIDMKNKADESEPEVNISGLAI